MGFDNQKSFIMAERLRQLRERKGLSHEKLSKALFDQYDVKISSDSLINYEVVKANHTKAYKNQGMRVEYLRCLADFYGVSADYILGEDVPMSPDITLQGIVKNTELTEDNVASLITWANLPNILQKNNPESLTDTEKDVVLKAAHIGDKPEFAQYLFINLIRLLVSAVINRADDLCPAFNSYMLHLEDSQKFKWGRQPLSLTRDAFEDLAEYGWSIVPSSKALRLDWEHIESILQYEINSSLQSKLEATSNNE